MCVQNENPQKKKNVMAFLYCKQLPQKNKLSECIYNRSDKD